MEEENYLDNLPPIKRVKNKRKLTQNQEENWKKALEVRKRNIALRKEAKSRLEEIERENYLKDPEFKSREKILKDMIMLMLTNEGKKVNSVGTEKVIIPRVKEQTNVEENYELTGGQEQSVRIRNKENRSGCNLRSNLTRNEFDEEDLNINIFKD